MGLEILIIDDDSVILRLLEMMLQFDGHQVTTVTGVSEAWSHLENHLPDLICLDLMMPEISGIDFLTYRQSDPELQKIPIIIISGANKPELYVKALQLGAETVLKKPFTSEQLMAEINSIMSIPVA